MFINILIHDIKKIIKNSNDIFNIIIFLIITSVLFPFVITDKYILSKSAIGIIWIICILTILLASRSVFEDDRKNGTIDMWLQFATSVYLIIFIRILSLSIVYGIGIISIVPIIMIMYGVDVVHIPVVLINLIFSVFGMFSIAILSETLSSMNNKSAVISMLVSLPFNLPLLIFANGTIQSSILGIDSTDSLLIVIFLSILYLVLCPICAKFCLYWGGYEYKE